MTSIIIIGKLTYQEISTITPDSEKENLRFATAKHMIESNIVSTSFYGTEKGKHIYQVSKLSNGNTTRPTRLF